MSNSKFESDFELDFYNLYCVRQKCPIKDCENFTAVSGKNGIYLDTCGNHTRCKSCKELSCWSSSYCFRCDPSNN